MMSPCGDTRETGENWLLFMCQLKARRRSESDDVFTGCQPQYPDLQGYFNIDSKGLQAVFGTTRHLPALTLYPHRAYSVIEEFVEDFGEISFGK